jgi:hypothetical protein
LQLQTQLLEIQSKPNGKVHTVGEYVHGILKETNFLEQASATYGTHAKRGTQNDFQWHAE